MKIHALLEIVSPKKPDAVKRGIYKKPGVQGSVSHVRTREFTTSKGNHVRVLFDVQPDEGGSIVDINFYVNDTHYDDSSTAGGKHRNDFEILSGVLYLTRSFVDKGKYDRIKFTAQKGSGDSKTVFGLDLDKHKAQYVEALRTLFNEIQNYEPSQREIELSQKRAEDIRRKFGKEVSAEVIFTSKLVPVIEKLLSSISSLSQEEFHTLHEQIRRWDKTINQWKSYQEVIDRGIRLKDAFESHSESGVTINRNRRASLYMKLMKKYFPDWEVSELYGDIYELVRK